MRVKLQEGKRRTERMRQGKNRLCTVLLKTRLRLTTNGFLMEKKSCYVKRAASAPMHKNSSLSSAYTMVRSVNTLPLLSTHVTAFSLDPRQ